MRRARWHLNEGAIRICVGFSAGALMLVFDPASAVAQRTSLENAEICSRVDRASPAPQIEACTALINSENPTPRLLAVAHNNRGNAYFTTGDVDSAIRDYDESLRIMPNYSKALNNRGLAYRKKGQFDQAIKDFDLAIELDNGYARAFANRADAYLRKGEYGTAVRDYGEAIRLEPGACWSRAVLGELDAALTDCNEAIRLGPGVAAAFDSRGFTYLKMQRWAQAIADFSSALQIDPRSASSLYGRGLAKRKSGNVVDGDRDIAAAKQIEPRIDEDFRPLGLE
jgi:tetratricopeptide (TPR) repeat protein